MDVSKSLSEFANEAFAATYLEVAKAYKEESAKNKYFFLHSGEDKARRAVPYNKTDNVALGLGTAGIGSALHGTLKNNNKTALTGLALMGGSEMLNFGRRKRMRDAGNAWREENGYAPRAITGIPKKNKMKSDNTSAAND